MAALKKKKLINVSVVKKVHAELQEPILFRVSSEDASIVKKW